MQFTAKDIITSAPRRFRKEKANGINTIFHFELSGEENLLYTFKISDNQCELNEGLIGQPKCVIKTNQKTYEELETGKANPQMALMLGKIKVSNLAEMMSFTKLFRKFDPSYLSPQSSTSTVEYINRPNLTGPLEGITVVDFSRLLPGPLASMFMADMGANVLKIEDPDNPDYVRDFEPKLGDNSAFYYALNRSKKSIAINFLDKDGYCSIIEIIKRADVIIEQYRPGVMSKFKLDYNTIQTINPKIIYLSITGYGQNSTLAQAAGHDLNYIATAGLLSTIGQNENNITIPGVQIADIAGGSYMALNAVLAALFQRERTGKGQYIDLSMTDAVLPLIALPFAEAQVKNQQVARGEFQLAGGLANYNVYRCADDRFLALGSLEPKFWNVVCEKLGHIEWQNEILGGIDKNQSIKKELEGIFIQKSSADWISFFEQDDVCICVVNNLLDLVNDKHIIERNLLSSQTIGNIEFKTIKMPVLLSGMENNENWLAPRLGEDTATVLSEYGVSIERINKLKDSKIIK